MGSSQVSLSDVQERSDRSKSPVFTDFVTLNTPESSFSTLTTQNELAAVWSSLVPGFSASHMHVLPSVQHAIEIARSLQGQRKSLDVLVCGSLHLVGGVIEVAGLADIALSS